MSGVFISYAWENGALAMRLHRDLERAGLEVWRYEKQNGDVGASLVDEIARMVDRCAWFILLDSRSARESSHVRDECQRVRARATATHYPARFLSCAAEARVFCRERGELFEGQNRIRSIDLTR